MFAEAIKTELLQGSDCGSSCPVAPPAPTGPSQSALPEAAFLERRKRIMKSFVEALPAARLVEVYARTQQQMPDSEAAMVTLHSKLKP
jgi:hypothetical protein